MLRFKDFFHLPQLDPLVAQLAADGPGLILVAGLDPRPSPRSTEAAGFLPSGRATIFRVLMREILELRPDQRAIIVSRSKDVVRIPRQLKRQVEMLLVQSASGYMDRIAEAVDRKPDLLAVDQLGPESAPATLEAARRGLRVLSQLETIFHGREVALAMQDLGVPAAHLDVLRWVLSVQRLPALCSHCKQAAPEAGAALGTKPSLAALFPTATPAFYRMAGCAHCHETGYDGEVTVFDFFFNDHGAAGWSGHPSLLSQEEYAVRLAAAGYLSLDDALNLQTTRLRGTYNLLTSSERALSEANAALQRKLAELEAANRVLQQRTEALVSLHEMSQTLSRVIGLEELAGQVGRHVRQLCGADRAILYLLQDGARAEILAAHGWDPADVATAVPAGALLDRRGVRKREAAPFRDWPPGLATAAEGVTDELRLTGLRVPLIAQGDAVGVMLVHTTQKTAFAPGEVALLQTFAHQVAVALQRAGLIDRLQTNLARLRTAQAELVQKERLDRELELARRVQQRMLPRTFPQVPGYSFAADNLPARQVGGDFYDVIPLEGGDFGLVIGDVSDKGMPAALYMALTRSLLQAEARRERRPAAVLQNVHQLLVALGEADMFVTVFYGVVEAATGRLAYVRAGHDWPLLLRDGMVQRLTGGGTALGFPEFAELPLEAQEVQLQPGDRLVLYTDGLTDALDANGQLFELERLIDRLRSYPRLAADQLCRAIFADLVAYQVGHEQHDDMAVLIVGVDEG